MTTINIHLTFFDILKYKKANHFADMCKTRDQKIHEVSDNPYQVSQSGVCRHGDWKQEGTSKFQVGYWGPSKCYTFTCVPSTGV